MVEQAEYNQEATCKSMPPVPAPMSELAAFCLLKLGKGCEAEAVLRQIPAESNGVDYYLGISLAHQGKTDQSVEHLHRALRQPDFEGPARQALLALLKKQAQRKMDQLDWNGAGEVLNQALKIDPLNVELQRMLTALAHHLPVAYLKANRRDKAAAAWEKAQKENPADGGVVHCLALLYFWEAQKLESQGNVTEAAKAWRGAIRNAVALRFCDDYWEQIREERERIYGKIPDTSVRGVSRKFIEGLGRKIDDYQNEYQSGVEPSAKARSRARAQKNTERMGSLALELAVELKTAEALHRIVELLRGQGKKGRMPPICGVLMLKHLDQLSSAQQLLASLQTTGTNEIGDEQLYWCLSPWALAWIMVQERRYEEAIHYLEKTLPDKIGAAPEGHGLLAEAYRERGKLLAAGGRVSEGLDSWKAALGHVRKKKTLSREIKKEAENFAIKEAIRLQNEDASRGLDKAIELIEQLRGVADSSRTKENLSELYTSQAIREANDESQDNNYRLAEARKILEKAISLNSGNGRAEQNLARIITFQAVDLINRKRYTEAIAEQRKAFGMAPGDDDVRRGLSQALSIYGVDQWNSGVHLEGLRLVREALEIDPANEHASKNLEIMNRGFT